MRILKGTRSVLVLLVLAAITASCTTAVSPTPSPSPAVPSANATPTATPIPTPEGFALPQGCSYVGAPTRTTVDKTLTEWKFTCGGAPDSVQRVSAALNQQGWAACLPQPGGIGEWWKGQIMIRVTSASPNANETPVLTQMARFMTNCP